ncbi:MAG: peptide chain release factor N(5)-glutamine methyltransferase [Cyanobacteria bacterium P01_A01_bin.45]
MKEQSEKISGLQLWQWRQAAIKAAIATDISAGEVDWLLEEVAGLDRLAILLGSFKNWQEIELKLPLTKLEKLWQERIENRMPVQYIAGNTTWRNFNLKVSPAVLIPRPETESLIDLAVQATEKYPQLRRGDWADLGTGSGAIALGLADAFEDANIHAVDCSPEALAIARANAFTHQFTEKIKFYQGCWWEPLSHLKGKFSGMVSNPPYIPTDVIPTLQSEVKNHEPHLALDGGMSGLTYISHLINISCEYLAPRGILLLEMMAGQDDLVESLLGNQGGYCNIEIHSDLSGIRRFALAYKKYISS